LTEIQVHAAIPTSARKRGNSGASCAGARAALIVALTIPFSLLFASIWLNASGIPANLLSLGALDFGMVVDGAVVMVEKHHPPSEPGQP
jgi:multidrug efflux pump subunit AcrB